MSISKVPGRKSGESGLELAIDCRYHRPSIGVCRIPFRLSIADFTLARQHLDGMRGSPHVRLVEEFVEPQAASPKRKLTEAPGQRCFLQTIVDCRLWRRFGRGIPENGGLAGKRLRC